MTFASLTTSRRYVAPSHMPWEPRAYQARAVEHLLNHAAGALFLDVGLGKTAVVLESFRRLHGQGVGKRLLVVAPLRVCQTVWRQEGEKWTQFRDLRFSFLHGSRKADRLKDDADIWLINYEGLPWLCDRYMGRSLPWDTIVFDELTKMKNSQAVRHKKIRKHLAGVARRWGLTGTPAANGYMDLFGQMLVLDDGAALGRYITHFRDQYFQLDYNGFDYKLMPGAEKRIEERIRPYILRMSAEDYLTLPPVVDHIIPVTLPDEARAKYEAMRKQMVAELGGEVVTAANAAAVYSKLAQMANGAVYDEQGEAQPVHDAKLEALDDLLEELAGQPLLLAYSYVHDWDRIKARYGDAVTHLGSGQSDKQTMETVRAWNDGRIKFLVCHPASAGHGLNLQGSGCGNIAWLGPIFDLELYAQFIGRVHRSGNSAERIINHIFVADDSIDGVALAALRDKDTTQKRLLAALNDVIHGKPNNQEITDMATITKLPKPSEARGWGKPAAQAAEETEQRERIVNKIAPQPVDIAGQDNRAEVARAAFSQQTQQRMAALQDMPADEAVPAQDEAPKPRTRRKAATADEPAGEVFIDPRPDTLRAQRVEVLKVAFADPTTSLDDGLEMAKSMWAWVTES